MKAILIVLSFFIICYSWAGTKNGSNTELNITDTVEAYKSPVITSSHRKAFNTGSYLKTENELVDPDPDTHYQDDNPDQDAARDLVKKVEY